MPSEQPASAAERQRRLRRGVRSDLLEIKAELRDLPDTIKSIVADCLAEQRRDQQQEHQNGE